MSAPKSKRRILVAEDDPDVAHLLVRALGDKYDVVKANDGPGALALAEKHRPDLILLDVMMPGLDGFGVAQRLKLIPETQKIPVIFITARTAPKDVIQGIQSGARAYITKPFQLKDVLEKVKRAIGE